MSRLYIITCIATITSSQSPRTIPGTTYVVDDALNRALLDKHNELRNTLALNGLADTSYNSGNPNQPSDLSQPTATYMNELHYAEGLAILAQEYLNSFLDGTDPANDVCDFGHNGNRKTDYVSHYKAYDSAFEIDPAASSIGIGENILSYTGPYSNIVDLSVSQAVSGWWDEYKWLDYSGEACYPNVTRPQDSCGHYTQMAWADTRYMGCGTITCGTDGKVITLCNYFPAGNFGSDFDNNVYKQPYPTGTPCSTCDTDAEDRTPCDGTSSGLCSGCQSEYFAYDPNDCSDYYSNCGSLSCPQWACPNGVIDINNGIASCSASWASKTCAQAVDEGIPFSKVLNGALCTGCELKCGMCTASGPLTAAACTGDGLDYTAGPTPSPTAGSSPVRIRSQNQAEGYVFADESDTVVVTESADWAIAAMCMVGAVCCIVLGIGYYSRSIANKVDQIEMELNSQKLINNGPSPTNQTNIISSNSLESIDMSTNGQEAIEIQAIIDRRNE